jgi:hypothetical protein
LSRQNSAGFFLLSSIEQREARQLHLLGQEKIVMHEKTANVDDEDAGKGAVEQDRPDQQGNVSLAGQIGHRNQDPLLKANDSDYPEPGQNPEHSGEPQARNQLNRDTEIACQDNKASRPAK